MKKITMYELLGMVKDGKAPKKIIYRNNLFEYICGFDDYEPDDIKKYHGNYLLHYLFEEEVNFLNDEVEILEEEPKVQVELTEEEYLEHLDKISEYMKRVRDYIPKPSFLKLEEEKKIPEKLYKYADESDDLACEWSFAEKKLKDKINEIIDYLNSKRGE